MGQVVVHLTSREGARFGGKRRRSPPPPARPPVAIERDGRCGGDNVAAMTTTSSTAVADQIAGDRGRRAGVGQEVTGGRAVARARREGSALRHRRLPLRHGGWPLAAPRGRCRAGATAAAARPRASAGRCGSRCGCGGGRRPWAAAAAARPDRPNGAYCGGRAVSGRRLARVSRGWGAWGGGRRGGWSRRRAAARAARGERARQPVEASKAADRIPAKTPPASARQHSGTWPLAAPCVEPPPATAARRRGARAVNPASCRRPDERPGGAWRGGLSRQRLTPA